MSIPGHSTYYLLKSGSGTYVGYNTISDKVYITTNPTEAYTTKNIDRLKHLMDINSLSNFVIRKAVD